MGNLNDYFYQISQIGHDVSLIVLILLSLFSIAFIIERFMYLNPLKSKSVQARTRLSQILASNNWQELESLSYNHDSIEGQALARGLKHLKTHGKEGLEEVFNTFALTERPHLDKHLGFLATVGSNAPFIGLLGTVFGVMDAFRGLALNQQEASDVMLGISKALVATGVGLLVAIPAVIAFNYFQKQVQGLMQGLDSCKEASLALSKISKQSLNKKG